MCVFMCVKMCLCVGMHVYVTYVCTCVKCIRKCICDTYTCLHVSYRYMCVCLSLIYTEQMFASMSTEQNISIHYAYNKGYNIFIV